MPPPSRRHGRLIVAGRDLWADRGNVLAHVRRRIDADPYCVLDVVLKPGRPFPLDLLDLLDGVRPVPDYTERVSARLGIRGRLRVSVLSDAGILPSDWLAAAAAMVPVVLDLQDPGELPQELANAGVGVRLPGRWDPERLLGEAADPDRIFFRSIPMEAAWSSAVLGLD
jgi:hypothetical protein